MKFQDITFDSLAKANATIKTTPIERYDKKTGKTITKHYAEVHQRIKAFRMVFPTGSIVTDLLSDDNGRCVMKATVSVTDDDGNTRVLGTGMAYEKENGNYINKTSYLENCETSAIGRALGMAGFGIDTSVASYEEVANAMSNQANAGQNRGNARQAASKPKQQNELGFATPEQVAILEKVYKGDNMKKLLEINKVPHVSRLTFDKANELLSLLNMEVKG